MQIFDTAVFDDLLTLYNTNVYTMHDIVNSDDPLTLYNNITNILNTMHANL